MSGPTQLPAHLAEEQVAGLAALPPDDAERRQAEVHAAGCASCRQLLDEAGRLLALLEGLEAPPPPSEAAMERARAAVLAEWAAVPSPAPAPASVGLGGRLLVVLATAFAWGLTLITARSRNADAAAWSAVGAAVAAAGALFTLSRDRLALLALSLAAVAFALAVAGPGGLALATAVGCTLHELVAAALPVSAAVWLARSGRVKVSPTGLAATAVAGGFAGQAALHEVCRVATYGAHLAAFHLAPIALAALAAATLAPRLQAGARLAPR